MISGIGLQNFQGFRGTQSVQVAPITVVYGPNASGKSSIGRAVRLFAQSTMPSGDRKDPGFRWSGPYLQLGSVNNWVSGKEAGLLFGAEIKFHLAKSPGVQAGMRIVEKSTEPYYESVESRNPSSQVTFEIDGIPCISLSHGLSGLEVDLDWSQNFLDYVRGELQTASDPQEKDKLEDIEKLLIRDVSVFSNRRFFINVLNASLFFKHIGFDFLYFSYDNK